MCIYIYIYIYICVYIYIYIFIYIYIYIKYINTNHICDYFIINTLVYSLYLIFKYSK